MLVLACMLIFALICSKNDSLFVFLKHVLMLKPWLSLSVSYPHAFACAALVKLLSCMILYIVHLAANDMTDRKTKKAFSSK